MAKVPGFLRPREVIDEAELERVRIRTLERLAAIFGDAAASLQAPTDVPAATEQPPAAQPLRDPDPSPGTGPQGASRIPNRAGWPPDLVGVMAKPERPDVEAPPDPAPTTGPRGASRPPTLAEWPPDLVGVMAKPERPDVEAPPEPEAATIVGVMAGHGSANQVGAADDWRTRADAYVLAVAFGVDHAPAADRGARPALRVETRRADAIQPGPAAGSVDLRREGPGAVEQVNGPVLRKFHAHRPRPVSGPAPE